MNKKTLCMSLAAMILTAYAKAQDATQSLEILENATTEVEVAGNGEGDNNKSWTNVFSKLGETKLATAPKFGGYIIGNYSYYDEGAKDETAGFNIRLLRLYVDGTVLTDFAYRIQVEMSGAPGVDKGARLLDAFMEWKKYPEFKVKAGQFKRAFTFENPFNPWNVGFGTYSQAINKLAGMSDRLGEHSSGGRDAGLQFQGDLFPSTKDGNRLLHYQIGVYNGQGINHNDANRNKDLIGGIWVSPIKNLRIGAFGWGGRYTGTITNVGTFKVDRNRWAVGVDYESDWVARAEYIASEGRKLTSATQYQYGSDKADAWYVTAGAPVVKNLMLYGKWDVYRDEKTNDTKTSIYSLALNFKPYKDLMFQLTYAFNQARSAAYATDGTRTVSEANYNQIMAQFYVRF